MMKALMIIIVIMKKKLKNNNKVIKNKIKQILKRNQLEMLQK